MPRKVTAHFLGVLLLCCSAMLPVYADNDAEYWLERAEQSMRNLNYEGTFVYLHENNMEAMQIVHRGENGSEHERLLSLNGEAREIFRDNNMVKCILPDSESVMVDKSQPQRPFPAILPKDIEALDDYYHFSVSDTADRVAGRKVKIIAIEPMDEYRFGYRLYVDVEDGLLLKSDVIDTMHQPIEQVMFTQIKVLDKIPEDKLLPTISGEGFKWYEHGELGNDDGVIMDGSQWKDLELPAGYMLDLYKQHSLPTAAEPVEHIVFSDGIVSVSVYLEPEESGKPMLQGSSTMGAMNAYGVGAGARHLTVVGEVPQATVQLIGRSVQHQLMKK